MVWIGSGTVVFISCNPVSFALERGRHIWKNTQIRLINTIYMLIVFCYILPTCAFYERTTRFLNFSTYMDVEIRDRILFNNKIKAKQAVGRLNFRTYVVTLFLHLFELHHKPCLTKRVNVQNLVDLSIDWTTYQYVLAHAPRQLPGLLFLD